MPKKETLNQLLNHYMQEKNGFKIYIILIHQIECAAFPSYENKKK